MPRCILFVFAPLFGLALLSAAGEVPGSKTPAATGKGQDIVFLGPSGPFLLRLHIEMDGQSLDRSFATALDQYTRALFRHLDRDRDGVLKEAEAVHLPPPLFHLPGGGLGEDVHVAFNFSAIDLDGNGQVSPAELTDYYRRMEGDAFSYRVQPYPAFRGDVLHRRLLEVLDTNRDGKLSRAEVAGAARALFRLDQDEDEIVSAVEVAPESFRPPGTAQALPAMFPGNPPSADPEDFLVLGPDTSPSDLARGLLQRYGGPGEADTKKVGPKVLGLEPALFARLDRNRDGLLDISELTAFTERPADVDLKVRLGMRGVGVRVLEAKGSGRISVRPVGTGGMVLQVPGARVELNCDRSQLTQRFFQTARQTYLREFTTAVGGKGSLDRRGASRRPFFQGIFSLFDGDGNDRLTEKELLAYLDGVQSLQAQAMSSRASLLFSRAGTGLWDLLDSNRDGVLGLREVRAAPALLATLDRNGDGMIAEDEIPASYQIALGPGQVSLNRFSGDVLVEVSATGRLAYPPETLGGGPLWFRKMDRNRDGVLSPREFLGTPAQFKALDTDGDGLISRDEAEGAEVLRKKR
jgi:Ca2+-binding EF-hand superfamily protein